MRIGHYAPDTEVRLVYGCIDPPTFQTEALRNRYDHPSLTDEDLFALAFYDFSRSIKVALLDVGPITPQELYARGEKVWQAAHDAQRRIRTEMRRMTTANQNYQRIAESIFQDWLSGKSEVAKGFELDASYVPEPYLTFGGASLEDEGR